ncbi:unnamed protein product [Caenorhabditis sp. 36 PRJEB53466]|nr:unnamed protein product [Caenorhabditis sp. 36 PRJEB53466]
MYSTSPCSTTLTYATPSSKKYSIADAENSYFYIPPCKSVVHSEKPLTVYMENGATDGLEMEWVRHSSAATVFYVLTALLTIGYYANSFLFQYGNYAPRFRVSIFDEPFLTRVVIVQWLVLLAILVTGVFLYRRLFMPIYIYLAILATNGTLVLFVLKVKELVDERITIMDISLNMLGLLLFSAVLHDIVYFYAMHLKLVECHPVSVPIFRHETTIPNAVKMSLSKLSQTCFSRHHARTFIRLSSSDFKSLLGPPAVANPFADNGRMRLPPIVPIAHGNVFASVKIPINDTPEAVAFKPEVEEAPQVVKIEKEVPRVEADRVASSPTPATTPSAIDELNSLKESLEKLEAAAAKTTSSGDSNDNNDQPGNSEEVEARRKRMERNTRIGGYVILGGSIVGFISFCLYYGRAQRDEAGKVIEDGFSGFLAPFYRIANSFKLWRDYVVEPAREQLLPDPLPAPYLQPKYTIVIELKNIMVHPEWTYKTGYRFLKRPALDYFLDVIGYPNFEVVIYSSESMMTAAPVVDSFDPKQRIMYKLFRDCTKYMNGHHVKDLSKLNRDLSKVIFIDFDVKSGQLNPENLLLVPEWRGNMDDTSLVDLAELLKTIHLSDTEDVRPMLQYYSQYDDPAKEFRRRAVYLAQQEEQKKNQPDESSMLKRYSGKLFGFRRHATV